MCISQNWDSTHRAWKVKAFWVLAQRSGSGPSFNPQPRSYLQQRGMIEKENLVSPSGISLGVLTPLQGRTCYRSVFQHRTDQCDLYRLSSHIVCLGIFVLSYWPFAYVFFFFSFSWDSFCGFFYLNFFFEWRHNAWVSGDVGRSCWMGKMIRI